MVKAPEEGNQRAEHRENEGVDEVAGKSPRAAAALGGDMQGGLGAR